MGHFILYCSTQLAHIKFFQGLDFVVDGGVRLADPSTVVDMTTIPPKIIRQGKVNYISS